MNRPTPWSLGYRMPAEWERQECVWLAWPTNLETWGPDRIADVRQTYVEVIAALSNRQRVALLVDNEEVRAIAVESLGHRGVESRLRFYPIETVDSWIRDYGPTFVVNDRTRKTAMVRWTFNAWGDKYADLKADARVPAQMNRHLDLPVFDPGIVLEGGSIDVNGRGTVLTTEQCLLNPNRNPHLGRSEIENILREFLGASNAIWLSEGIAGDDTDGHIDDIARFVDPTTVLVAFEDDPADENHGILKDCYARLVAARDEEGRKLGVLKLPMPDPIIGPEGRLPASYANFYIGNGTVVVPTFGQPQKDRTALAAIQSCFPSHRVVGVGSTALLHGLGTLHCCSQQQPVTP